MRASRLRIGVLAPIGTSTTGDGHQMVLGAMLAAESRAPTGPDIPVELVIADTADASDEAAIGAAERLIGLDVDAVVSGYASRTGIEIDILAAAELPYVVAEHSIAFQARVAAALDRYPTVWGLMPSYDPYGSEPPGFLAHVLDQLAPGAGRRVFIIGSANEYSRRCMSGMRTAFTESGWEVVGEAEVPFGVVEDWAPLLDQAAGARPDVLASTDFLPYNAAALVRAFHERPVATLLHQQYAPKYPEYAAYAGPAAAGVIYDVLGGPIEGLETTRALRAAFRARFDLEPSRYAFDAYQGVRIVQAAAAAVGRGASPRSIGRAIGEIEMDVVEGRFRPDPATHLGRVGDAAIPMRWYQRRADGSTVCLAPAALRTGDLRRPDWLS